MRNSLNYTIFSGKNSTGIGSVISVKDFRHKELVLATTGMGAGDSIVVQIQGSFEQSAPNFGSARSASNLWDYIQVIDLEDGAPIDGDTGVTFSDANDVKFFSINIDGLQWISLNVTTVSDTVNTTVTGKIYLLNDN